jgi:predicted GIY-YIG superfamily endonuclease
MAFWCYILRCADGKYYTGHTDDLERRMAEHYRGGYCDFTSRRLPVTLIWASDFPTRYEALSAELKVKKWSRAKKEALAASDWKRLSFFAKPPRERVSTSLNTNGGGVKGELEGASSNARSCRAEAEGRSRDTAC